MLVVAVGLVALAGCGGESGAGGSSELGGKTYLSTAVTENGAPKMLAPNTRIRLEFRDDGTLTANAGCNSIGGKAATGDGKLKVDDLAVTEMGCDAPRHAQDTWLVELLQSTPHWKAEADKLTITSGGTVLQLQDRETAQPDVALDGTKWILESVVRGETVSTPGNGGAHLTFNGERVTGSTSCNELQGVVARTSDKLTFGELGTTRRACSGPAAELEKTVLATLNGEVTYTLDADRLRLRTPANDGLDLKAAD
jgi:heat shock protein HslJ